MKNDLLQSLTKEELIRLIEDYSKNWLAMDGYGFSLWNASGEWMKRCIMTRRPGGGLP